MANSRVVYRTRKVDRWVVYDDLPPPVRKALQEGPNSWDAVGVRRQLNKWTKEHKNRAVAISMTVALINQAHQIEIERALPWNGMKILPPENRQPSPHILAQATMQLSGKR